MIKGICRRLARRAMVLAAGAGLVVAGFASPVQAQEEESAYSFSFGYDKTSHFISYGLDVWGGGGSACPFGSDSTSFAYGTVTAKFNDQISGFVNVWADINDNIDSDIGGVVQEVDLNIGGTFTMDKFAFTLANGCWWYAGDTEHILDFTVAYSDGEAWVPGLSINPSLTLHYRYEGNGGQDEGLVVVPGIKPTFTLMKESDYPVTVSLPVSLGFFTDDYHGGDSGFGYFSAGVAVSVPLSFIPEKFGVWSVNASAIYYCTEDDVIPSNPADQFTVTSIGIGVSI
jgi:hypothetical protein